MKIEILKPIVGVGDCVEGFPHRFALDPGMIAEVENRQALRWIEGGLARRAEEMPGAEAAMLARPAAKPRKKGLLRRGV